MSVTSTVTTIRFDLGWKINPYISTNVGMYYTRRRIRHFHRKRPSIYAGSKLQPFRSQPELLFIRSTIVLFSLKESSSTRIPPEISLVSMRSKKRWKRNLKPCVPHRPVLTYARTFGSNKKSKAKKKRKRSLKLWFYDIDIRRIYVSGSFGFSKICY